MVAKRNIALLIDMILINLCWVVYSLVMIPILYSSKDGLRIYSVGECRSCGLLARRRDESRLYIFANQFCCTIMKKGFDSVLCVLIYFAIAFVLMLVKDAVRGMSVGKFIVGIQVVDSKTGKPIGLWQSALRNSLLYLFSGIEFFVIVSNSKGLRLGDRLAETRVVDAKDQGLSHYLKRLFK